MATLRKITLNWEIRTGAITCDTGYIKRQELCDVDLYVTVDGTPYALDTSWALNLSVKPALLGDNAALVAVTTWTASATTGLYQATAQTIGGTALDTYLAANNADTTDDEGNKLVDLDVYYTVSMAMQAKSDTVTVICKPDVGRADDTVPATIIARNDFLVSNGTGLLVNVAAGYAANGAFVAAQASLAITNATNYIEVTAAGVASVNTTAFTAGSYPLATVVASAGAITANTDLRAWITPKPATGGGVTSITGTANEITVTGTTTPTLSLPSALTFTGKTVTGGTFASPTLTTPTIGDGTESAPSLSFTTDANTGVYRPAADTVGIVGGGNDVVRLTGIASATDYLEIKNGIGVGSPLHVLAEGASANIGVHLQPKGSGLFTISDGTDFNKGIRFRSSSSAASAITLLDAVSTAGRVVTLPDATGTLALVSGDLGTPSALVGTNITGTASGLTAGNATLAATVTVANEAADTTCFPLFATAATGSLAALSNAGLTFNSATGLLSATGLAGAFNGTVGATTPDVVNTTKLNARDSSGTITASIDGADGTASFVGVTTPSLVVQGGSVGTTQIDSTGTLWMWSNTGSGQKWLKLDSNDDSVKLYNSAGGYSDPPTITITSGNGSASFANGYAAINSNGSASFSSSAITFGYSAGTAAWINSDGSASFASGALTTDQYGNLTSHSDINVYFGVTIGGAVGGPGTLNVKNSSGTTTASINGTEGTASFAEGGLAIDQYGNITTNGTAEATLYGIHASNILTVGTEGSAVGTIDFSNATSGTTTLSPATGALGSGTVTLPLSGTLATLAGTETLTNKRLTQRTGTATSSATPTINTDNVDFYSLTAQAADITSFTTNLSGTPTDGQQLWIAITGTAARAITWGATFEAGAVALPTTTVTTTRLDVAFIWNPVTSKWRCMASG